MIKRLLLLLILLTAAFAFPSRAAITFFGQAHQPTSAGGSLNCSGNDPTAVTPPGSMLSDDYVVMMANTSENTAGTGTLAISAAGGQTWTSETQVNQDDGTAILHSRLFHTRYNGTWSTDPSVSCSGNDGPFTMEMLVFRGVDATTAVDVSATCTTFEGTNPGGVLDITISAITTNTNNAMVVAFWNGLRAQTSWTLQTGGWTQQQTIWDNLYSHDNNISHAYKIQAAAGSTGDVTNQEASGGRDGTTCIIALKVDAASTLPRRQVIIVD